MFYEITDQNIKKAVDMLRRRMESNSANRNAVLRWTLLTEQLLILYRDQDEGSGFELCCMREKQQVRISLVVKAADHDYLQSEEDPIIAKLAPGVSATFERDRLKGCNIITGNVDIPVPAIWNLRLLMPYLAKVKWACFAVLFFQIIMVFSLILIPVLTADLITAYVGSEIMRIIHVAGILMLSGVLCYFCEYVTTYLSTRIYHSVRNGLEIDLSWRVLRLEDSCFTRHGTGMFVQRMVSDVDNLAIGFNEITSTLSGLVQCLGVIIAVGFISVPLCLIFIFTTVLTSFIELRRANKRAQDDRVFRHERDRYTSFVTELIRGVRDIKHLNSIQVFVDKMSGSIHDANRANTRMERNYAGSGFARKSIKEICDLVLYTVMAVMLLKGRLQPSMAIIVLNYNISIAGMSWYLASFLNYISTISISSERIFQILFSPDFPEEKFGDHCPDKMDGNISFQNVTFSYEQDDLMSSGRTVLDGVSFEIAAGEKIAIVGKSGSGKTTILNLLMGLYRPLSGKVLIDGKELSSLRADFIRGNISSVSQNPYVFNMSVRENLSLACENITKEDMDLACRAACIYDDIMVMPKGYDTLLGEDGVSLSGGQRQRLAIARCLLRKSRIILLDEATSALDNEVQGRVIDEIGRLFSGCTVITVAHRFSTIVNSDRILFLSEGKILAEGSHEALLRDCEAYRRLYHGELQKSKPEGTGQINER